VPALYFACLQIEKAEQEEQNRKDGLLNGCIKLAECMKSADVAQSAEQLFCKQQVIGSSPIVGSAGGCERQQGNIVGSAGGCAVAKQHRRHGRKPAYVSV
jgi:hypothetical protein